MRRRVITILGRSVASVLVILLTSGLLLVFRERVTTPTVALLYLLPVGLTTALWGLAPGLVAALGAFIAFNYLFLPPYFTLHVLRAEDIIALVVFLVVAVTISQLVGRAKTSLVRAQAREHEAVHLHELTGALVGLTDSRAIVRAVAEQVQTTFGGDSSQVSVQPEKAAEADTVVLPFGSPQPAPSPTCSVPIQGMHGQMGQIALWRASRELTEEEEQLLRTFGRETALAVERAGLALAENRARALAQSDALKSVILSSVSHELRTPLATIKAAVTSLRSGAVDWDSEARQELLEAVEEESDHLNELVGNLLDMSRIEAGSLNPRRQWNDLGEIVRSVLARMKSALRRHTVLVDIPADLPLIAVDFVQIEQVLGNLLSNSAKYSPPGTTIAVRARPDGSWAQVEVQNEGPTIPDEYLERVFDKFFRVTAREQVVGTGLGLSICKGIIEAHGGRIWAENLARGMVFRFRLPTTWEGVGPQESEAYGPASPRPGD